MCISRRRDREVVVLDASSSRWIMSASAPAISTPVGAAADDDEVQRAPVDQRGVAVGVLEHADDARAQPLGVVERVERERVAPRRPGVPKKFGCEPGRQHDGVAGPGLAVRRR